MSKFNNLLIACALLCSAHSMYGMLSFLGVQDKDRALIAAANNNWARANELIAQLLQDLGPIVGALRETTSEASSTVSHVGRDVVGAFHETRRDVTATSAQLLHSINQVTAQSNQIMGTVNQVGLQIDALPNRLIFGIKNIPIITIGFASTAYALTLVKSSIEELLAQQDQEQTLEWAKARKKTMIRFATGLALCTTGLLMIANSEGLLNLLSH